MPQTPMPDVIVLLPGIMGSILQRHGDDVWAPSGGAFLRGLWSLGDSIRDLAIDSDNLTDDLGDGVTAPRLMPDAHLIPGFWKIDGYGGIRKRILSEFDAQEGQNYFEFPYDWRRDNRVSASKLQRATEQWLHDWRQRSGNSRAKLILVGHSMGGLVARYFLEVLGGWEETKLLVTFGTPHRGSLNALNALSNGVEKLHGLLDVTRFVRSLPSVYQLLPTYKCYDPGNGQLARIWETPNIPHIEFARAREAVTEFHQKIDQAVDVRRNQHGPDSGYTILPIVGRRQPTRQSAVRDGNRVRFLEMREGRDESGDGTVPLVSSTPLELSDDRREMYRATRHASLQNDEAVLEQLCGAIVGLSLNLGDVRGDAPVKLALRVEDAYSMDEPILIRVQPTVETIKLTARFTPVEKSRAVAKVPLIASTDGWYDAELPPLRLKEGIYRVAVSGNSTVEPVADIFAVVPRG